MKYRNLAGWIVFHMAGHVQDHGLPILYCKRFPFRDARMAGISAACERDPGLAYRIGQLIPVRAVSGDERFINGIEYEWYFKGMG